MRRLVYIVMFLLIQVSITNVFAGERSKEAMKMAALNALNKSNNARKKAATTKAPDLTEYVALEKLSIIGSEDLGFAVVTNDDRFDEVIGYSFTKFSKEMPCGFRWWMEAANRSMEMAKGQVPVKARNTIKKAGVGPLITTKWGQQKPFNNQCVIYVNGEEYPQLTGCVATAMAQVMNYYKYPAKGKGENNYTINYRDIGEQTYSANFENSYYDWDNMLDDYSGYRYSDTEDKYTIAVSKLMSDCGKAVNMRYTTYASGASSYYIPKGLKNYFSYSFIDETTTIYIRNDYSNDEDWMNLLYDALNNNHPILYRGDKNSKDGHMFVIHGYETDGKVIVNWGWNGNYDGSFMIDMLTPGTFGEDSFNDNQQMIIPIPEGNTTDTNVYKLSYFVDGVLYKEYELKAGETITHEPTPTKEGYTFSGWSTIPKTMPANDVTITGSFTKGTYKLTYILDDEVYKTINYDFGATITPEAAPIKEGYTFSGWSEIPETMPAKDVNVTGSFIINKYKLIYQVDGVDYKTYEVEYGATITPEPAPTKDGYIFIGWSNIPSTMPNHNVTIIGEFVNNIESGNTITVEINGIYYTLIGKARTAEVTSSPNKYSDDITIPESVEYEGITYQVTQIGEKAFISCNNITSVIIPNSVTTIGAQAFSGCSKLSSVDLPNSVQDIGSYAFSNCINLTSIIIPYGITTIRQSTFYNCNKLTSVKIPDTVTSIEGGGLGVFDKCSALESISLPPNLNSIGTLCFNECKNLTSIVIPDKVANIYSSSFYGCSNLKTITIGKAVTRIWDKSFAGCKSLENVICLAENPPTASSDAFENSYIEYITLYVPENSVDKYKSQEPWSKFKNILGKGKIIMGDANADGKVDTADVEDIANHIMGKPTSTGEFDEGAADMNGDKVINAADIVMLIDLLTEVQ